MNTLKFSSTHSLVDPTYQSRAHELLIPSLQQIKNALKSSFYESDYAALHTCIDQQAYDQVQAVAQEKKSLHPAALIVIGIGGSNLGAQAVIEALKGKFYNQHAALKIYWADTVDSDYISALIAQVRSHFDQRQCVVITIISKSGTTTETVANGALFIELLKQYHPTNYHKYVVTITDRNSLLWRIAEQEKFSTLEIPAQIGGRFSVLSAVGLFPLMMLAIDCEQLLQGARAMLEQCLQPEDNPAAVSATVLAYWYGNGCSIHDTFLFSVDCQGLGMWYRQLLAESLGKEFKKNDQTITVGITPTVSVGSVDLHSMGQLYVGGPRTRVTTFVSVNTRTDLNVPACPLQSISPELTDQSFSHIMQAIMVGVQRAYRKRALPFMSIEIPSKNPYYVGQFLSLKMMEVIYLGNLLGVYVFDQPQVELYKKETREILTNE